MEETEMARRKKSATVQIKVRIKEELRARLEKAAKARGVSLNAEIGDRLENSFEYESRLGGPLVADILESVGAAMRSTGELCAFFATYQISKDGKWLANPYAFDQATNAAMTVIEAHRPPGKITAPSPTVHQVVGGDPKESAERVQYLLTELGRLMAEEEIRSREQSDE